jgi:hypothetical protein
MGYGGYSQEDRLERSVSLGYHTKAVHEIFNQRGIKEAMSPYGMTIRESRDSDEHPNSVAIIIALDVTGSMERIPHKLVKDGLPTIMANIISAGIPDPQVMFIAIGDHKCDFAPLQVGQFESNDALLDHWLTTVWLEGHGGANNGESYSLAHYLAARYTSIDCFEKRKQKGILITIGDEFNHSSFNSGDIEELFGVTEQSSHAASDLIAEAQESYHVFHLHVKEGSNGTNPRIIDSWKKALGENCVVVNNSLDIPMVISKLIYGMADTNQFINNVEVIPAVAPNQTPGSYTPML